MAWSKRKKTIVWIASGVTAIVAAGAAFAAGASMNNAGRFDQAIDGDCAPVVVLAFRGSSEANLTAGVTANAGAPYHYGESDLVTNGWEGVTLGGLFEQLSTTTYEGFRADGIPVVSIGPADATEPFGYDAIDAITEASSIGSALTYSNSRLLHSAARGAEAATHLIHDYLERSEGCPIAPKFVVVGYSQGAMAARHTAELNPESVSAVLKIGDPYQRPQAKGVRAAGAAGIGIIRWKADDVQRSALDAYYDALDFTSSICHQADPICEFEPISGLFKLATGTYADHLDYYSQAYPDEARDDALVIAKLAYERWLVALEALEGGSSVSWGEAQHDGGALRALSMSIAGTPTLLSAMNPSLIGSGAQFAFDLDGDGVYETTSTDGTVWVTFDDDEPRKVGVRVSVPGGGTTESTTTVTPAPKATGGITFTPDGELIDPAASAPAADPPPAPPPATTPPPRPAPPAQVTPPAPVPPSTTPPVEPDDGEPGESPEGPVVVFEDAPAVAGTELTARGTGFTPNSTVMLSVDGLQFEEVHSTDERGEFTVQVIVPGDAETGEYVLRVYEDEDVYEFPFEVDRVESSEPPGS